MFRALHLILSCFVLPSLAKWFCMTDSWQYKQVWVDSHQALFPLERVEEILKCLPTRYNEPLSSVLHDTCSEIFCLIRAKHKNSTRLVLMLKPNAQEAYCDFMVFDLSVSFSICQEETTGLGITNHYITLHYIYFVSTYFFKLYFKHLVYIFEKQSKSKMLHSTESCWCTWALNIININSIWTDFYIVFDCMMWYDIIQTNWNHICGCFRIVEYNVSNFQHLCFGFVIQEACVKLTNRAGNRSLNDLNSLHDCFSF